MIAKSAINKNTYINNILFTINARAAWEHILLSMKNANIELNILMPSYIGHTDREGSGVFDPLVAQNAKAEFYNVKDDLSIDLEHFKSLILSKRIKAALIIHYFGFCRNDMNIIKTLCKENSVLLIEDCAHAFQLHLKDSKLGKYGDFSFYSIHKYLPTNAGGILKNNTNLISNSLLHAEKKIDLADIEHYAISNLNEIAEKRRENYELYEKILSNNNKIEVMYELREGDIPQTFPIKIKNGLREKLYFYLMEKGAPTTALYYRMIKEISPDQFPISHHVASEILNLPVHQDTEKEDINYVCDLINEFYKKAI
jgi:dTDP-4-amino-4,6-dideoxygalactose transaminase